MKLGKEKKESLKRNYYNISPEVILKIIIIIILEANFLSLIMMVVQSRRSALSFFRRLWKHSIFKMANSFAAHNILQIAKAIALHNSVW